MFRHKKYLAVMIICFLLGGFSLILFLISINAGLTFSLNPSSGVLKSIEEFIPNSIYLIFSSLGAISFIYSAAFIIAGVSIFYLIDRKEKKSINNDLSEHLLSDDEKRIINLLKSKGVLTQKEIEKILEINKAKLSRTIKKLCEKSVLKKISHGMTNKIILLDE